MDILISFAIIFIFGILFSKIFEFLKLPTLLGLILAGFVIGPRCLNILTSDMYDLSGTFREIALIIIVTKGTLSINLKALKGIKRPSILMCFIPATLEILVIAILSTYLFDLTFLSGLLLGTVTCAVSPAIIVPNMINILDKGYDDRPPQIVLIGSSIDGIFAVMLFSLFLDSVNSGFSITEIIPLIISIIIGVLLGFLFGVLIYKVGKNLKLEIKIILILSASFILVFLDDSSSFVSGLIGIVIMSIYFLKKDNAYSLLISKGYNKLWSIFEVILFVFVGSMINLDSLSTASNVLGVQMPVALIIIVILIIVGVLFRMLGVFLCLFKTYLSIKERLFCAISYIPKATVQASIGATAMLAGIPGGEIIFIISIITILLTAPVGSVLINTFYPKLLRKK